MLFSRGKSALLACCLAVSGGGAVAADRAGHLQLAIWGGSHGAMLDHSILTPFSDLTRIEFRTRTRQDNWSLLQPGAAERVIDDVVEMELHEAVEACDSNSLALLPGRELDDFVPNTLQPCAVGQYVWATLFAYDRDAYREGNQPSLVSDFFNLTHFPGKRAVRRSPRVLAEWSLLAAGIPAAAIYDTLARQDSAWQLIERELTPIASSIVWVNSDEEAIELLENGTVSFAMLGSDALVEAVISGADDLQPVWDGAVNQVSLWGIPANAKNPELAWKFVRYATSIDATRRFSSLSGYGPARFSVLEQLSADYHRYLPSTRENLRNVVWGNSDWWRNHGKPLDRRFARWLAGQFARSDS